MPVNATARKFLTDLLKGVDTFADDSASDFNFATVGVEGSGAVLDGNIGLPLIWDEALAAYKQFVAEADWTVATAYSIGDVRMPTTRNGFEAVCTVAGTSHATTEPVWPLAQGADIAEATGTVEWVMRKSYAVDPTMASTLPNKARIALTVGSEFGLGFNKTDRVLSATPVDFTVLYRGPASIVDTDAAAGTIIWGAVAAADKAEFLSALQDAGITTVTNAEVVSPTFTS